MVVAGNKFDYVLLDKGTYSLEIDKLDYLVPSDKLYEKILSDLNLKMNKVSDDYSEGLKDKGALVAICSKQDSFRINRFNHFRDLVLFSDIYGNSLSEAIYDFILWHEELFRENFLLFVGAEKEKTILHNQETGRDFPKKQTILKEEKSLHIVIGNLYLITKLL